MEKLIIDQSNKADKTPDYEKRLRDENIELMIEFFGEKFIYLYAAKNLEKLYSEMK